MVARSTTVPVLYCSIFLHACNQVCGVRNLLFSFISVSERNLMQNECGPWHKIWQKSLAQKISDQKALEHLCKHMAFFQRCRQCSHSLKIHVWGNIHCPEAVLYCTRLALNICKTPRSTCNIHMQYPSIGCSGISKHYSRVQQN